MKAILELPYRSSFLAAVSSGWFSRGNLYSEVIRKLTESPGRLESQILSADKSKGSTLLSQTTRSTLGNGSTGTWQQHHTCLRLHSRTSGCVTWTPLLPLPPLETHVVGGQKTHSLPHPCFVVSSGPYSSPYSSLDRYVWLARPGSCLCSTRQKSRQMEVLTFHPL